jgi:DNA polymerase delta subunit 1
MLSTVLSFVVIVSGEHTRTIQIATPTVGGLMKFAVKTVTCLGCKTPLRANNSVSSAYRYRR